jgi:hypothetical protein
MPLTRHLTPVVSLSVVALLACGCSDGARLSPGLARGTYALESVSGRGPSAGTIVLSASGAAERRVRYPQPGGALSAEYIARGTFRLIAGSTIELQLREDDGRSPNLWRQRVTLTDEVLQLRYPDPADGPDIVESYRRQ